MESCLFILFLQQLMAIYACFSVINTQNLLRFNRLKANGDFEINNEENHVHRSAVSVQEGGLGLQNLDSNPKHAYTGCTDGLFGKQL